MLAGERGAGTAQTGLDLVGDHQGAPLSAEFAHLAEEAGGRDDHPGLALDRLDENADYLLVHRGRQGLGVAVGQDAESRGVRAVGVSGVRVGREAHDRDRAAVEVAVEGDDHGLIGRDALDLVAPLAGRLDRGLDAFGAGVHRQDHLHAGHRREFGAERSELVVLERPADQGDPLQLTLGGRDQARVPVAEVDRRVGGEQVEVPAAFHVGHPGAFGLGDHDRQRMVVMRAVHFCLGAELLRRQFRRRQFAEEVRRRRVRRQCVAPTVPPFT